MNICLYITQYDNDQYIKLKSGEKSDRNENKRGKRETKIKRANELLE